MPFIHIPVVVNVPNVLLEIGINIVCILFGPKNVGAAADVLSHVAVVVVIVIPRLLVWVLLVDGELNLLPVNVDVDRLVVHIQHGVWDHPFFERLLSEDYNLVEDTDVRFDGGRDIYA